VALFLTLSTVSFASIQLNPVEKGDITLIEPQIGSERQVFVKESMAISIRSDGDYPVDVSMYKVMPSAHNTYLDEACDSEMILTADEVPFVVRSGSSIVAKDLLSAEEEADKIAVDLDENDDSTEETVDSDDIIDGTVALLQKEKLSSKDRQTIIEAFKDARKTFEHQLEKLEDVY
jgi:hypothetical protein